MARRRGDAGQAAGDELHGTLLRPRTLRLQDTCKDQINLEATAGAPGRHPRPHRPTPARPGRRCLGTGTRRRRRERLEEAMRMADKTSGPAGAAGRAPAADQPAAIRNVVLVGHTGAGKTTLVESLLVATGTITWAGRVEDGTTVTDFDEAEHRQQ